MKTPAPFSAPLRAMVLEILENRHSSRQLDALRELTGDMALACLKRKLIQGEIHPTIMTRSLLELARESTADLFRPDATGYPSQIRFVFGGIGLTARSDQELLVFIRRLIFRRVNEVLLKTYSELDPALGRILEGIRTCLDKPGPFAESEQFGISMLTPVRCKELPHRPILDLEAVVEFLSRSDAPTDRLPAMMEALALYIRSQSVHARTVPLLTVALAYREYLSRQS